MYWVLYYMPDTDLDFKYMVVNKTKTLLSWSSYSDGRVGSQLVVSTIGKKYSNKINKQLNKWTYGTSVGDKYHGEK